MTVRRHNPPEWPEPADYSEVTVATGQKLVFVSGQVGNDAAGHLVGPGDLAAQARQAFRNVITALGAGGASPTDIAKMTWYVVNYSEELLPAIMEARRGVFGEHTPATTMVGVQALARPRYLIEVEAIAVLD